MEPALSSSRIPPQRIHRESRFSNKQPTRAHTHTHTHTLSPGAHRVEGSVYRTDFGGRITGNLLYRYIPCKALNFCDFEILRLHGLKKKKKKTEDKGV
ncbi:hypothetical protein QQP08_001319 [Theobroma cacao]|nr:hypothetical protein QQP08_001319 [Theobroma cacao]